MDDPNLAIILDAIPEPILLIDSARRIAHANSTAKKLFGGALTGGDLVRAIRHPGALDCVDKVLAGGDSEEVEIVLPVPVRTTYQARAVRLDGGGDDTPRAALILHDMSAVVEAEQMRVEFVANVSHELRSPLTALSGFIETLQGPAKDDPEARARFLDIMGGEAERMKRLIDDLLSLSGVEVNEHVRPEGEVDIHACAARVVELLTPEAQAREMTIRLSAPDSPGTVTGDDDEVTEVIRNLVENAIKYGREGGGIEVALTLRDSPPGLRGETVAIAVSDEGEGIAEEHIPRLTERFYRVDKSRSRERGGTGLGLAIVKHIVNRHRGRLTINSEVGKGSTFTVYLPRR